jgi:YesN/AraC family two-component response regulator
MPAVRILCVDDDASIRELLPKVLALHGYEAAVAASVSEALSIITSQKFDVLISDLNMGSAADGFTVVSAMKRINPECVNFILTGYPAFESALQALRAQVDDYFIKPADIPQLLKQIEDRLNRRDRPNTPSGKRLSEILRDNVDQIVSRTLEAMKKNSELSQLPLSDDERVAHLDVVLRELADHLDSKDPNEGSELLLRSARRRGELRLAQHVPIDLMVHNERVKEIIIDKVIFENLLAIDLSNLLADRALLNDALLLQMGESVRAYVQAERSARH